MQEWMNDRVDPRLLAHEDRMATKIADALDERQARREQRARTARQKERDNTTQWLKIAGWISLIYVVGLAIFLHHLATAPVYGVSASH